MLQSKCSFCEEITSPENIICGADINIAICRNCTSECAKLCLEDANTPVPDSEQPIEGVNCQFCLRRNSKKTPILIRNGHAICLDCIGRNLCSFITLSAGGVPAVIGRALFRF
jgi:hypothetical protein